MARPLNTRPTVKTVTVTILFFLGLGVVWEASVRFLGINSYILPSLSEILFSAWKVRDALLSNSLITLREVAFGFFLAVILGAAAAVTVFGTQIARSTLYPLLVALQSIPKVGLAPLMVVWLGYGLGSKVLMTFLFAFFPIVISTLAVWRMFQPIWKSIFARLALRDGQRIHSPRKLRQRFRRALSMDARSRCRWPSLAQSLANSWALTTGWEYR